MLYIFWSGFLTGIQWWCCFCDWSNHIWQHQWTHECHTSSVVIFWCEFNSNVSFMIRVTIYSKTGKHIGYESLNYFKIDGSFFDPVFKAVSGSPCCSWVPWEFFCYCGKFFDYYYFLFLKCSQMFAYICHCVHFALIKNITFKFIKISKYCLFTVCLLTTYMYLVQIYYKLLFISVYICVQLFSYVYCFLQIW